MNKPITQAQLDTLERAVDKVFGRIGIDVEFTRHFLDRVNDERNRRQITIRELAELFAKEYKRWGRDIARMPIDSQAVMKDLSSEINIPFVLNPDDREKDLVAKTVMRKKNFKTPNKELPVESVVKEAKRPSKIKQIIDIYNKTVERKNHVDYNPPGTSTWTRGDGTRYRDPGNIVAFWGGKRNQEPVKAFVSWLKQHPKAKNIDGVKDWYGSSMARDAFTLNGVLFTVDNTGKVEFGSTSRLRNSDVWAKTEGVAEEKHGAKRGTQVKGKSKKPKKTKPSRTGSQPHPMRGKLVGEKMDQPPLDRETKSVGEIAQMHGVSIEQIEDQLEKGIQVEIEHSKDEFAAMEIALDHLMELPDYYDRLATIEPHHYTDESVKTAWENYQKLDELVDPNEAILNKALAYLDRRVKQNNGRQSLAGLAFDVAREINLSDIASAKELSRLYRDWKGDNVVTEGWMEENLYYLDEVVQDDKKQNKKRTKKNATK